jgi:hypothetical protein
MNNLIEMDHFDKGLVIEKVKDEEMFFYLNKNHFHLIVCFFDK